MDFWQTRDAYYYQKTLVKWILHNTGPWKLSKLSIATIIRWPFSCNNSVVCCTISSELCSAVFPLFLSLVIYNSCSYCLGYAFGASLVEGRDVMACVDWGWGRSSGTLFVSTLRLSPPGDLIPVIWSVWVRRDWGHAHCRSLRICLLAAAAAPQSTTEHSMSVVCFLGHIVSLVYPHFILLAVRTVAPYLIA